MSKKLDEAYLEALDKIADLEAKLAEKDRAIENWQTMYQSVMQSCHNGIEEDKRLREQLNNSEKKCLICHKDQENEQLKRQLKFKEKENNILKKIVDGVNKLKEVIVDIEDYVLINPKNSFFDGLSLSKYLELGEKLKQAHQDKISFAVEQLEQIKRFYNEYNNSDRHTTYEVKYQLDMKIEELKKEMK